MSSDEFSKKQGQTQAEKTKKVSKGTIIAEFAKSIHPVSLTPRGCMKNIPKFKNDLRFVQVDGSLQYVKHVNDGVIKPITIEDAASAFACSFGHLCIDYGTKEFTEMAKLAKLSALAYEKEAIETCEQLNAHAGGVDFLPLIIPDDDVAPVRFFNEDGWTWHRLSFDPDTSDLEAKEYWETEIFPRFKKNFKPFMAWCGSLFDLNSPRVLCPWLYGEGATGKGTLAMFIMQSMGKAGTTIDPDHFSFDKFALESLEGKRFAFIDEAPSKLPTSAKFKRMTGEKYQLVNKKGIKAVPMRIDAKPMFASNHFPSIKSGKEFARRIMPVPFNAIEGVIVRNKEDVIKLMHKHAAYFWGIAVEEYNKNKELADYDVSEILEYQEDMGEIIDLWIQRNIGIGDNTFFPIRDAMAAAERDRLDWYKVHTRLKEIYKVNSDTRYIKGAPFKCLLKCSWKGREYPNFSTQNEEMEF